MRGLLNKIIDVNKVISVAKRCVNNDSILKEYAQKQLIESVKKKHPENYIEFMKENEKALNKIKAKMIKDYKKEVSTKLSFLLSNK